MNNIYFSLRFIMLAALFSATQAFSQADTTQMPPPPKPIQQNAGFDVIIKTNGDILYGLVTEVGQYLIYYKRTDIPDGPIYNVPRNEVYAISYRNQVKDYIHPADAPPLSYDDYNDRNPYSHINYNKNDMFSNGTVRVGVGFIRSFTKVDHANNYSANGGAPVISLGYEVYFKDNIKLGAMLGFGSHKFSSDDYSTYDSTFNSESLKENIFGLYVYGNYSLLNSTSRLQPYITLGLGIATSHVSSENKISFLNDDSKVILVKSGARGASLNIMARIGAQYFFSKQLQAFVDAGSGLSIINLGVAVSVK